MRYVLAIVALVFALPFLGYGGFLWFVLIQVFLGAGDINADTGLVVAIAGVALLIGLAFLAPGVAILASNSQPKQ
jgi:hypothetical protein